MVVLLLCHFSLGSELKADKIASNHGSVSQGFCFFITENASYSRN